MYLCILFLATPPNAMIYSNNEVRIRDLIIAGFGLKIFGIIVIFCESITILAPIFRIHEVSFVNIKNQSNFTN